MKLRFVVNDGQYSRGDIIDPDMPGVIEGYLARGVCVRVDEPTPPIERKEDKMVRGNEKAFTRK